MKASGRVNDESNKRLGGQKTKRKGLREKERGNE